ncbi:MAG TPA: hypothetical protein DCM25_04485 [Rhodobacteraceae bacterium]|nr:hypothetical protein [Paracoccaceae bacterium]
MNIKMSKMTIKSSSIAVVYNNKQAPYQLNNELYNLAMHNRLCQYKNIIGPWYCSKGRGYLDRY